MHEKNVNMYIHMYEYMYVRMVILYLSARMCIFTFFALVFFFFLFVVCIYMCVDFIQNFNNIFAKKTLAGIQVYL